MFTASGYEFKFHHLNANGSDNKPLGWPGGVGAITHCNVIDDTTESYTFSDVVARGVAFTRQLNRKLNRKAALADALRILGMSKDARTYIWRAYFNATGEDYMK